MSHQSPKTVNILGVTGSVGQATTDVILQNPDLFDVQTITAHQNGKDLENTAARLNAKHAVLTSNQNITFHDKVDITVCAIAGMAGLESMMDAIAYSHIIAIANKEPLVAAGELVIAHAKKHSTKILPLDSEHNAIFQVFDPNQKQNILTITITGSGGPFRGWGSAQLQQATKEQALNHPNWSMGKKITIDSATLANKALELIEAAILFDMPHNQIDVVIHPQSIIHSMVSYKDGSTLAQLGESDMRVPIAYALGYPRRIDAGVAPLDFKTLKDLTFEPVNHNVFPFIQMARDCLDSGQHARLIMNAANEIAVEHFLQNKIKFTQIVQIVQECLDKIPSQDINSLSDVLAHDNHARIQAQKCIQART